VVRDERWGRAPYLKPLFARVFRRLIPAVDVGWSIVEVRREPEVVARRGFVTDREADEAQRQFVVVARRMTDAEFGRADWQSVLDEIEVERAERDL